MKTNQLLLLAGVGVVAYLWWKNKQGSSNATGRSGRSAPFRCPCECKGQFMGVAEKCCGEGNREIC